MKTEMRRVQLEEQRDPVRLIMLVGVSVLIGIVGLVFLLATRDSTLIKNVLFSWLVLALFLAFLIAGLFTGEMRAPRSKIVLPLAVFVGWAVVSTAVFRYAYAGVHELASLLCGITLAYVATVTVTDRTSLLTVTSVLGGVAVVSCVYGIAQHFGYDPILRGRIVLPEVGRSLSTMGHPNFFGAFLVLAIPVLLALFFSSRSPLMKAGAGALVCAALLCLLYTRSRGAWLGFVGALPVWFFLSLPGEKMRWRFLGPIAVAVGLSFFLLLNEGTSGYVILWALPLWLAFAVVAGFLREKFSGEVRWTGILLVCVILVSNVFVEGGEIAERADAAFETEKGSVLARRVIWTGSLNMFKAKPVFGWGLGRFSIYFPRFRDPATAWKIMQNTLHAHSEYLEVAAEMGIVGLAVFLWMMGAFLWESAKKAIQAKEKWRRFAIAGLAAGCLAILIHASVNVDTRWTVGRFFLWLGIGLTIAVGNMSGDVEAPAGNRKRRDQTDLGVEAFYRIRFRPVRWIPLRVWAVTLAIAMLAAAGSRAVCVFRSAVFTARGEGYEEAARMVAPEGTQQSEVLEALDKKDIFRDEAIQQYQHAVKLDPHNLSALYKLAHCYNLQGRFEESLRTYRRMAKLSPDGSDIHYNMGAVYANLGRWEESKKEFEKALRTKVGPLSRLGLARAYENLGRFGEAEGQYRVLLKWKPEHVEALSGLGRLLMGRGNREKALELYERVLRVDPQHADARLGIGLIYQSFGDQSRQRGNEERAMEHYRKGAESLEVALGKRPENVPIRAALALVYADLGRFPEALRHLQSAAVIKPREPLIFLNLGKAYVRMKEPEQAAEAFRRTIDMDSKGPWAAEARREMQRMRPQ